MSKKLFIILSIILLIIILIFISIDNLKKKQKTVLKEEKNINEETIYNSNIIKNINYSSKDLKGNKYIILADEGEIDLNNSDIIYLTGVTARIELKDKSEVINISSDFGKYNSLNFDTIFSRNVIIDYIDNEITSEYLDYSMMENKIIISKNVVYKNLKNILKADVIELDTLTKDTKIFMHNTKQQVTITSIN